MEIEISFLSLLFLSRACHLRKKTQSKNTVTVTSFQANSTNVKGMSGRMENINDIPYRRNIYKQLNRTSSRKVRVTAACGLAQEFWIVLPAKVKINNSTSSAYSRLYGRSIGYNSSTLLSIYYSKIDSIAVHSFIWKSIVIFQIKQKFMTVRKISFLTITNTLRNIRYEILCV